MIARGTVVNMFVRWICPTKGWGAGSIRSPSIEMIRISMKSLGSSPAARVATAGISIRLFFRRVNVRGTSGPGSRFTTFRGSGCSFIPLIRNYMVQEDIYTCGMNTLVDEWDGPPSPHQTIWEPPVHRPTKRRTSNIPR